MHDSTGWVTALEHGVRDSVCSPVTNYRRVDIPWSYVVTVEAANGEQIDEVVCVVFNVGHSLVNRKSQQAVFSKTTPAPHS